ncbi:hypothetical protein QTP88_016436 [Uroleucon formosanum]
MSHTFTSESTKRNLLSSSSSNPNARVKTLKTFVSPLSPRMRTSRRFLVHPASQSPLNFNAKQLLQYQNISTTKVAEDAKKPSPPIVINNVTNYSALKANFISLLGADGFTVTTKGTSIHIKTRNCTDYYKLIDYCNDQDLEAHTWAP